MENNVTSLLLKLTLQKNKLRTIILLVSSILVVIVVGNLTWNQCSVQHIQLISDLNTYERSLDPEYCEDLLEKIDSFNEQCEPQIEILDCG